MTIPFQCKPYVIGNFLTEENVSTIFNHQHIDIQAKRKEVDKSEQIFMVSIESRIKLCLPC